MTIVAILNAIQFVAIVQVQMKQISLKIVAFDLEAATVEAKERARNIGGFLADIYKLDRSDESVPNSDVYFQPLYS